MRRCHLFFAVVAAVLISPVWAIAEDTLAETNFAEPIAAGEFIEPGPADSPGTLPADAPAAMNGSAGDVAANPDGSDSPGMAAPTAVPEEVAWDQFDDPDFDPAAQVAVSESSDTGAIELDSSSNVRLASGVVLGPAGVDDQGRAGRLHTVATGDTLWDLAAAYLGTPWVWPSVWTDNGDIDNPHRISPGDKIWITANEMRVVSDAEAEAFIAPVPEFAEADAAPVADVFDTGVSDEMPVAAFEGEAEVEPSTLDAFPVAIPGAAPQMANSGRSITVSRRETMGYVSAEQLAGASRIVDSPSERTFLGEGDKVYLGLGEGDVEVGDEFTIFRVVEQVRDVESNRLLGHHIEPLGWVEVSELTGDTSIGEIRTSFDMIERGERIMPRVKLPARVAVRITPDVVEGEVVFLPTERTIMGDGGYVYLNRGEFHGVETGSQLEVFESGRITPDRSRRVDVRTPDRIIANLVVVSVQADSSVAFVLDSNRELEVGDRIRPAMPNMASR